MEIKFGENIPLIDEIVATIALRLEQLTKSLLVVSDYQDGNLNFSCRKLYLTDVDIDPSAELPYTPTGSEEKFLLVCPVPKEMPDPFTFMLIVVDGELKITSGHPYSEVQIESAVEMAATFLINSERITKPRTPPRLTLVKKE